MTSPGSNRKYPAGSFGHTFYQWSAYRWITLTNVLESFLRVALWTCLLLGRDTGVGQDLWGYVLLEDYYPFYQPSYALRKPFDMDVRLLEAKHG